LRGLLKDDQEWDNVMREVCEVETHGLRIRELYFSILLNNSPESNRVSNAGVAGVVSSIQTTAVSMPWHERMFRDYWEDMGRGLTDQIDKDIASTPDKLKQALRLLVKHTLDEELVKRTNKTQNLRLKLTPIEATMLKKFLRDKSGPTPRKNMFVAEQMEGDKVEAKSRYLAEKERATPTQRAVLTAITERVEAGKGGLFFIDAPGGTGDPPPLRRQDVLLQRAPGAYTIAERRQRARAADRHRGRLERHRRAAAR
jgi:hypothetical protein